MKEQASSITIAKVEELCRLIPALNNELNLERGQTRKTKEDVEYVFKNGSKINILAAKQSSRGQRRVGGVIEECVLVDGEVLNEVIIPTTNIDRLLADGTRVPDEMVNKSQVYITTAGSKKNRPRINCFNCGNAKSYRQANPQLSYFHYCKNKKFNDYPEKEYTAS